MPNQQPFNPGNVIPPQVFQQVANQLAGGLGAMFLGMQKGLQNKAQRLSPVDQFAINAARGQLGAPLAGRRPAQPNAKPFRNDHGF